MLDGKTLKELVQRISDDAEVVHLFDNGFAWREDGVLKCYSFKELRK